MNDEQALQTLLKVVARFGLLASVSTKNTVKI
jgi:hypothetical protein